MKPALALITALLLAPLAALHAEIQPTTIQANPFPTAKAVWRMAAEETPTIQPFVLSAKGPVKFEQLGKEDAMESRKRGGADTAVALVLCQWPWVGWQHIADG
jgi:hypothetical protein